MFLVVDGLKAIKEYEKQHRNSIKEYKKLFKGWGYMFKEVKPKGSKKPYYYWYKWEYDNESKNNVWTYVGKNKPDISIPEPPKSRLEDINFNIVGSNILIDQDNLNLVQDIFNSYQTFQVNPS